MDQQPEGESVIWLDWFLQTLVFLIDALANISNKTTAIPGYQKSHNRSDTEDPIEVTCLKNSTRLFDSTLWALLEWTP